MKELFERIKEITIKRKISQRTLAEMACLTETSVSRYFTGSRIPSGEAVVKMAEALGYHLELVLTTN